MLHTALVLGLGDPARGDDGFGPLALAELQRVHHWDARVSAVDLRGIELHMLPLLATAQHLLVLAAVRLGATPGTIHRLEWSGTPADLGPRLPAIRSTGVEILRMLHFWLDPVPELIVLGVEATRPASVGMSPIVRAAVGPVLQAAVTELRRWGHRVTIRLPARQPPATQGTT